MNILSEHIENYLFNSSKTITQDLTLTVRLITIEYEQIPIASGIDPWGRYRDPDTWQHLNEGEPEDRELGDDNIADWVDEIANDNWSWFRRGYTGHEMLPEFGLINMNGRAYDPVLGRMLQVDNYVQNPFSSQSYNRYSYVLNNPLKYMDPSGENPLLILGSALLGGFIGASAQQKTIKISNWNSNWWQGAVIGGLMGAGITSGIIIGNSIGSQVGLSKGKSFLGNSLLTANTNILSSFLQGNNWEQTAKRGIHGFAIGMAGSFAIRKQYSNVRLTEKAIKIRNYVTGGLLGASDRYLRSKEADLEKHEINHNVLLGMLEGLSVAWTTNEVMAELSTINISSKSVKYKRKVYLAARYGSTVANQLIISKPGLGFSLTAVWLHRYDFQVPDEFGVFSVSNTIGTNTALHYALWRPISLIHKQGDSVFNVFNDYRLIGGSYFFGL